MFSLALRLGRTVSELLDTIDAAELQEWFAFYELDPWTTDRQDAHAAMICSTIARVNGADLPPSAFMPEYGPEPEPKSDEELRDIAFKLNAMMGGTVK
jgi:hypothetical protein